MDLIFASHNDHKIVEVQGLMPAPYRIIGLKDVGITEELEEPYDTFEDNANAKAQYIYQKIEKNCFAEDSGLCVHALDGAPGVFSSRYAGIPSNDDNNNQKLIKALEDIENRKAHYVSVIILYIDGHKYTFRGECHGTITRRPVGNNGFGYDPLFIPDGHLTTFGEMTITEKLKMSHRTQSMNSLINFLKNYVH